MGVGFLCLLPGCASRQHVLYDDVEGARALFANILQPGMSLADARDFILREFPKPTIDSAAAPIVAGMGGPFEFRRHTMAWPTIMPGENIVLTMYFDRKGELVRWVVGRMDGRL